jgi:lipopolysaccharide biosynthesis protein
MRRKPSVITLADQARDAGQWDVAVGYYREALRRKPRNPPIWVQYGHVLKQAGHLAQAEQAYRTSLAYDWYNADSHVHLGHALKIQGKTREARAAYLQAIALNPSLNRASFEFAQLGWSQGHLSELHNMLAKLTSQPTPEALSGGASREWAETSSHGALPEPHLEPVENASSLPSAIVTASANTEISVPDLFELRGLQPRGRVAVVLHLYYPELWAEMRESIARISEPFDLFVSLTNGTSTHMRPKVLKDYPHAWVFDFENHGRDIGPFLVFLQSGALFRYELICKLHTKRSPHEPDGDAWRRALIDGVLGSSRQIEDILSRFRSDPDLGMVVAEGNIYSDYDHWSGNEMILAELLPRIGIAPSVANRSFPGGSIFWIRSFLLRTLQGTRLNLGDFEPEPLPRDGRLAHAVERMFGLICEDAGMRVAEHSGLVGPSCPISCNSSRVHVIAYYLPQFHPISENEQWWGSGFTEWTNVTRAKPLFDGHRQPRLPADLGFCDLRLSETREAQAALARKYGIAAFCYYYYWFNGRRILERPLEEVLASGKPDFPFLICWANEPWSRNWDGLAEKVLLPQTYAPGWIARFAQDIAPLLHDRRYFCLEGRPMLLIYRIAHIPDPGLVIRHLREALLEQGVTDVHIAAALVEFTGDPELPADPRDLGLDAYFEFPPHRIPARPLQPLPSGLRDGFIRDLYDYNRTVEAALATLEVPVFGRLHRCVMAAFDNSPRKGPNGHIYHGATPTSFRRWLRGAIEHERHLGSERVVFVNAWNEWAEGTCLEPDRDFGCGWLEAVASATGANMVTENS